ncbi:MAG: hypothetical protein ABWZ40_08015, partial [Caulobacterales bacterium]
MLDRLRYTYLCTWAAPVFLLIFIVFWGILGHNIPPVAGNTSAADMGALFRNHRDEIRLGMVVAMSGAVLYMIFGLAITKVIQEGIECGRNDMLSTLQLWGAGLTVVPVLVSCSFWLTGAYRPDALPDNIL